MRCQTFLLTLETGGGIALHDLTPEIAARLAEAGVRQGFALVISRHTTTAIVVNENEPRLHADLRAFLARLAPPQARYLHNDIHLRDCPPDEPENAHAHILAMLLGSSEALPIEEGRLAMGRWQSVFLVELDGPRQRTVTLQVWGE
ncbi:MAG: secondary thiamine-phosphate synthase enzyme YjbQ [Rhodocyclaceae bacterium]|nr:secondary thiamine-phosphate synthase enzyme YjbQ [Rhodocyclaceae bacterium]